MTKSDLEIFTSLISRVSLTEEYNKIKIMNIVKGLDNVSLDREPGEETTFFPYHRDTIYVNYNDDVILVFEEDSEGNVSLEECVSWLMNQ